LSPSETFLLSKGLTFIPLAKDISSSEIISDFNKFADKLQKRINPPPIHPNSDGFDPYRKKSNNSQSIIIVLQKLYSIGAKKI